MMHSAMHSLTLLVVVACVASVSAIDIFATTTAGGDAALTVISKNPLVLPGGSTNVTFWVTFNGLTAYNTINLYIIRNFTWTGSAQAGQRFSFEQTITAPNDLVGVQTIYWGANIPQVGDVGTIASTLIEISCSDGNSCNGDELFVNNVCVPPDVPFCDYGTSCTTTACNTDTGLCNVTLRNDTCLQCNRNCDYLGCDGKQCGTDGCGGNCGTCGDNLYCNSNGQCITVTTDGVCSNPIKLFEGSNNLTGVYTFTGNTSQGYHRHVIPCNYASTSPELVYTFTIPEGQTYGFDFRSSGFDTVMDVRRGSCEGDFIGCNDDATPPSLYGSRVARLIGAGTYYVIVKGYSVDIQGEFNMYMSFQDNCIPKCNSQFCGDDECGGTCGTCNVDETCSANFKCVALTCEPNCTDNECGFDGCGGYCGTCTDGTLCNLVSNRCEFFPACDGLNPTCTGCNETQFCGSDCQCYDPDAPLPDLFVERERLAADIVFDSDVFKETSCAYREGCIAGIGRRRLLRFSVLTTNQGRAAAILPYPPSRPDMFVYSPCHGHYHFTDYAYYALLTPNGSAVVEHGRKQGYCVLDGDRRTNGSIDCVGTYTCDSQGISVGWADTYTYDLDCQWIDITDVVAGDYLLYVELNRLRKVAESDYSNNKAWVPVTIPPWDLASTTTTGDVIVSTTGSTGTSSTGSSAPTAGTAGTAGTTTASLENSATVVSLSLLCLVALMFAM